MVVRKKKRTAFVRVHTRTQKSIKRAPRSRPSNPKTTKVPFSRSKQRMTARVTSKKSSMKKRAVSKNSARAKAPRSFLHKMLTAEGWKRLMTGKSRKK